MGAGLRTNAKVVGLSTGPYRRRASPRPYRASRRSGGSVRDRPGPRRPALPEPAAATALRAPPVQRFPVPTLRCSLPDHSRWLTVLQLRAGPLSAQCTWWASQWRELQPGNWHWLRSRSSRARRRAVGTARVLRHGTVRYHHDILQAAIVHPDKRQVLPLALECWPARAQGCPLARAVTWKRSPPGSSPPASALSATAPAHRQQDCEINAGYRMLQRLRTDYPRMDAARHGRGDVGQLGQRGGTTASRARRRGRGRCAS